MIRGVDVSNHQDRVDWARAKKAGVRFAFVKASEGVGFTDPKFRAHVQGAKAAGIKTGAYHFARPDTNSGSTTAAARSDARAEADFFLSLAAPRRGDLLPALDLETAGLPPALMVEWTRAWLERVRSRIGARPLLYTYPAFWSSLSETTAFRNYPLWIANYEVAAPVLPRGWKSYTIWQYSSSGSIPGIAGGTDVNQLGEGVTLRGLAYRPAKKEPAPPQNLPGPIPKPAWFWPWLSWKLGVGEFVGLGGNENVRPDEAPQEIPDWARRCVETLARERSRK